MTDGPGYDVAIIGAGPAGLEAQSMVDVSDETFELEVTASELPVAIDFWAPWCGPCRYLGPIVEELAGELAGRLKFLKANTDETTIHRQYGIKSIPTIVIVHRDNLLGQASWGDLLDGGNQPTAASVRAFLTGASGLDPAGT